VRILFKVLILEDDRELNRSMCAFLRKNGFNPTGCENAKEAYDMLFSSKFDIIIADIMLPDIDGFEFATAVRVHNRDIPMMFVTALDDFDSKQRGFNAGIDDYMTKPVDLNEMLLRINALMRRSKIASSKTLTVGGFTMDADAYVAKCDGEELGLTVREFNILFKLLSYPGKTFTRFQLMEEFWGAESSTGSRTVDVYMAKIREKLAACPYFEINTVRGLGYRATIGNQ
jgi:two-component system, OmpR family, response regulator